MKMYLSEKEFTGRHSLLPFLKELCKYCMRYKRWFPPFFCAVAVVALADAVFPLLWMHFLDDVVTPFASGDATGASNAGEEIIVYMGYYLIFTLCQVAGVIVFTYYACVIQENLIHDLRQDMFNKLQRLSFSFYDRSATGWLITRITSDTDRVSELISWGLLSFLWGIVMILVSFSVMFFYSWKLTLVVLASIPLLFAFSFKLRLLVLFYARVARKVNSEMTAVFTENVNGIEINKVTAQETNATARFAMISRNMQDASYRSAYASAIYNPMVVTIGAIATAIVLVLGGEMALAGTTGVTVGLLVAFFSYSRSIYEPITDITDFYAMAQSCLSAGERIFSLLREEETVRDTPNARPFDRIRGRIDFQDVDFNYVAEQQILKQFNLTIYPAQVIALVGPTGSGKSTIASLVSRFYEPTSGAIYIDGQNYKQRTLRSLREQLGIVLQTPHVFTGTILDNIRYANFGATETEATSALRRIGAEELIPRLHESVGEDGSGLSTGQKQLIAFARILLRDPRILIMDEATSSVDTITEERVQNGIETIVEGRTSIIIAHRLSTICNADRILVVRDGGIVEDGGHAELIEQKGFYYDLWKYEFAV